MPGKARYPPLFSEQIVALITDLQAAVSRKRTLYQQEDVEAGIMALLHRRRYQWGQADHHRVSRAKDRNMPALAHWKKRTQAERPELWFKELIAVVVRSFLVAHGAGLTARNKLERVSYDDLAKREGSTPERIRRRILKETRILRRQMQAALLRFAEQELETRGVGLDVIEAVLERLEVIVGPVVK